MDAITLFAGAGGADIGLQRAGVKHLACVEGDVNACATLRAAGFPAVHAWIGTPPPGSSLTGWRWDGGPVDLLWASPPCQPYSQAGKQLGADDPRDGWPATLEAIRQIRPRWVIVENVGGSPIDAWAAELGPSLFRPGLYPHVSTRFLDAADWGLPSHRRREFLVAGPVPYRWPEPTHCGPDAPVAARLRLLPWNGFGAALGLVDVVARQDRGAGMMERHGEPTMLTPDQPMGALRCGGQGGYLLLPAPTICGAEASGLGSSKSRSKVDAAIGRRLTCREAAILVGFPPDYPFAGGSNATFKQAGNAVAPIMAEVLARSLSQQDTQ